MQKTQVNSCFSYRFILFFMIILISLPHLYNAEGTTEHLLTQSLKVGVYENSPKIFTTDQGEVRGFFPDILTYIASEEGWEIEYVAGSWSECLDRLANNTIDLLPDVGYSDERALLYDFNDISALTSWALIYTRTDSEIKSLDHLQNKLIGVMKDDIDYIGPDGIQNLSDRYHLNCTFLEYNSLDEVLEKVEEGAVDAGVVNELFGNVKAYQYNVIKTAIVFNPIEFKFGMPQNASLNPMLAETLDYWLENLKGNPQSYYYETYQLHFSEIPRPDEGIPSWILALGIGLVFVILLSSSITLLLRHQVRLKTEKLFKSEQRFRSLVESSSDWIWEVDLQGRYTYVSPKAEDLLGYKPEHFIGNTPFVSMPAAEAERVRILFQRYIQNQQPFVGMENTSIHKNGRKVILETSGVPIFDEKGNLVGFRGVDRDVTAFKEVQERYLQAQKMEAIGQFAGGIAHDFNNLLTVITGFSHLLLDTIPEEYNEFCGDLREILKAGNRATELTKQLLAFSRKQIFQPKVIDLNHLLQNMEKMVRRLIGEDVSLILSTYDQLGHTLVDPGQIEQVIMNLVVNARDAMPHGGTLTVETANFFLPPQKTPSTLNPGEYVQISISDTGIGISPSQLGHIFEPFFTTKEVGKGTGLGLSTVFGIIKQSNGDITVSSQVGNGSTFTILLPVVDRPLIDVTPSGSSETGALRGSETIVVVEDEELLRSYIIRILTSNGYHVLSAEDPTRALEIFHTYEDPIHLLITDVVMPIMNGKSLVDLLHQDVPDLLVLFMSGYTERAIVDHGILKQGLNFLPKPFSSTDLLHLVKTLLSPS
ncbi:MAG: PAS domain S-box protein, partial [Promethearchaeota archaeon]